MQILIMVTKKELEAFLKSSGKAKLVGYKKGYFQLEFGDDSYHDLKAKMESTVNARLEIIRVEKKEGKSIVSFSVVTKSPADEILDVFSRYYEGTKPFGEYEED